MVKSNSVNNEYITQYFNIFGDICGCVFLTILNVLYAPANRPKKLYFHLFFFARGQLLYIFIVSKINVLYYYL